MTHEEFSHLLDTHGSNWPRWPDPLRLEAQALLAESSDARALYEETRRLDSTLDQWRPAPAGDRLKASILERTVGLPQQPFRTPMRMTARWNAPTLARIALFAGLFLLGIALGSNESLFIAGHKNETHLDSLLRDSLFAEEWIP